ncbi:MAG TPA: hypothetical protein VGD11_05280 [Mycobacteriales bacterium]
MILVPVALALLATSACSSGAKPAAEPTKSVSAEDQILGQYRRLWTETLPQATAADAKARKQILAVTLAEPALSRALTGLKTLDENGRTQYGKDVPLSQSVRRTGNTAVVSGCLDSSKAGAVDRATGRKINRGPATNPVTVTLTKGPDGVWRVSNTVFGNSKKC